MHLRGRALILAIVAVLGAATVGAAPAGATRSSGAAADAETGGDGAACPTPPLTVTILPGPIGTTGPTEFAVTDAVARRVPIVPRRAGIPAGGAALDRLEATAARTHLALYTMYLADFPVPRRDLRGTSVGDVTAPDGKTVAAVTIVPTEKRGFRVGDVAEVSPFAYDSATTFAPLSLVTNSSGKQSSYAYDGIDGGATIRALDATSICLDLDVTFTQGGRPIATIVGTVAAPVVKSDPAFFYT